MTDLHAIREQLREVRNRPAAGVDTGSGGVSPMFWIVAVFAAVAAFAIVLLTPRIYSVQRTASLPTFQETRDRLEAEAKSEYVQVAPLPPNPARYTGKSADEMGKLADEVCFQRAHATQRHWSKTPRLSTKEAADFASIDGMKHFDALMECLVTEAPARYCSERQRTMITAEIAAYFRGVERANEIVKAATQGSKVDPRFAAVSAELGQTPAVQQLAAVKFVLDPKVLTGIEELIRAGYLTMAERSSFGALAPKPIRERMANVVANVSTCPKPPWWASWK